MLCMSNQFCKTAFLACPLPIGIGRDGKNDPSLPSIFEIFGQHVNSTMVYSYIGTYVHILRNYRRKFYYETHR